MLQLKTVLLGQLNDSSIIVVSVQTITRWTSIGRGLCHVVGVASPGYTFNAFIPGKLVDVR